MREGQLMGIMLSLQEVTKIYPGAEHIKAVVYRESLATQKMGWHRLSRRVNKMKKFS